MRNLVQINGMLTVLIFQLRVCILTKNSATKSCDLRTMPKYSNCTISHNWIDIILSIDSEPHEILIVLHLLQLIIVMIKLLLRYELVLGDHSRKRRFSVQSTLHAALNWVDLEGS